MTVRIRELRGKAIVDLRDGVKIGMFEDLMVSPDQLVSKALITSKGTMFNRRLEGIAIEDVRVWGRDVILVENQDVIRAMNSFPDNQSWVPASEQLKQRTIVSIDGKRIGQVDDLVMDNNGRITGIALGQVFVKGAVAQMKEIPIDAIRSLGSDVVIVDMDRVEQGGLMDEPDLSPETASSTLGKSPESQTTPPADVQAQTGYSYERAGMNTPAYNDSGAQIYERNDNRR